MNLKLTEIFTFEHLLKSYRKCAKGKRHKREVMEFKEDLFININYIVDLFAKGYYPEITYYSFMVYEPKKRTVWATHFAIRVIQACFCDYCLNEWFEPRLMSISSACRKRKGITHSIGLLKAYLHYFFNRYHTNEGWVLKIDIRKYFDNINHDILKKLLKSFPESEAKEFLFYIIDSYPVPSKQPGKDPNKGLPLGNRTSQLLALFYSNRIDRFIKEVCRMDSEVHYMDDFLIIARSRQTLIDLLEKLNTLAKDLDLTFNEKTMIFPLSNKIGYLGWNFILTDTGKVIMKQKAANRKRSIARYKYSLNRYHHKAKSVKDRINSIQAINAHLMWGNTYFTRKKLEKHQNKKTRAAYISTSLVF